jgi:S-phase kinase-associated protein 1
MLDVNNSTPLFTFQVIEYSKYHVDANKKVDDKPAKSEDDIKAWDAEFVKVDQSTLFDLILVSMI